MEKHVLYLPARDIGYGIVLELKMESNKGKHRTVRVMWIFEMGNVFCSFPGGGVGHDVIKILNFSNFQQLNVNLTIA